MMFPADPLVEALRNLFQDDYDRAVVYGDAEGETVIHEGQVTVLANGWVAIPDGRLLSPDVVHHIETYPDRADTYPR